MAIAANLGFPRIGAKRELKKAVESYWKGNITEGELATAAKQIREGNWEFQKKAGLDFIPSNDFSYYDDKGLDTSALVGAIPDVYNHQGGDVGLATYFAMARGAQTDSVDVKAMEMSKYFDTNYHYIVPEFSKGQRFALSATKIFDEFKEAKALGIQTRPVIMGPISYLLLGKSKTEGFNPISLLDGLLEVYVELLQKLQLEGATNVQIDEPCLVLDLENDVLDAYKSAFEKLAAVSGLSVHLVTYFGDMRSNLDVAVNLPVQSLHVDLTRGPAQLDNLLAKAPQGLELSLGVVDGRNIWRNDFEKSFATLSKAADKVGADRLIVAPSCSLLHSPVCLNSEEQLDAELKQWLAFATQKVEEVVTLTTALNDGQDAVKDAFEDNIRAHQERKTSVRIHNDDVKSRCAETTDAMFERQSPYAERRKAQEEALRLPLLPTTTIGSFPQTAEVRKARADFKKGAIDRAAYDAFLKEETTRCIRFQEQVGLDVLVHGEFERNDMVEYFGEKLDGFAFTKFGWVQSYGSRCVKPPIIFGDVSRPEAMTVKWATYAQSQTDQYMKGMLTGPVTILQWSFVRDDQPRSETCKQIALAIRDEVVDLEEAGIKIIQIDEAALREGLPLRHDEWNNYLTWAVDSFRLTASGVKNETQIHTHMCYSEFNDIIKAVARMDADVISIETSRSQMELLDAFIAFKYPNEIGPGVYDIHSPRVPSEVEMKELLEAALQRLAPQQLWVNPDCGLKTRGWPEVELALKAMVNAAQDVKKNLGEDAGVKQAS